MNGYIDGRGIRRNIPEINIREIVDRGPEGHSRGQYIHPFDGFAAADGLKPEDLSRFPVRHQLEQHGFMGRVIMGKV